MPFITNPFKYHLLGLPALSVHHSLNISSFITPKTELLILLGFFSVGYTIPSTNGRLVCMTQ